jgi:hypothetical protein
MHFKFFSFHFKMHLTIWKNFLKVHVCIGKKNRGKEVITWVVNYGCNPPEDYLPSRGVNIPIPIPIPSQGCQTFLDIMNQNGEEKYQMASKLPNGH